ncbi:hypothetical protein ACFX2G_029936 [Malus domestica]
MIMQANIVLYLTNVTKLKQQLSLDVCSSHSLKEIVKNWTDSSNKAINRLLAQGGTIVLSDHGRYFSKDAVEFQD